MVIVLGVSAMKTERLNPVEIVKAYGGVVTYDREERLVRVVFVHAAWARTAWSELVRDGHKCSYDEKLARVDGDREWRYQITFRMEG
jgi:hypothetical protein